MKNVVKIILSIIVICKVAQSQIPNLSVDINNYALLSGGIISSNSTVIANGKIGSVDSILGNFQATDSIIENGGGNIVNITNNILLNQSILNSLSATSISNFNNVIITPGVYSIINNVDINGTLNLTGNPTDTLIINIDGNLLVDSTCNVIISGIKENAIIWNISGNVTINSPRHFPGVIISSGNITYNKGHLGLLSLMALGNIYLQNIYSGDAIFIAPNKIIEEYSINASCTIPPYTCNYVVNYDFELFSAPPSFTTRLCGWYNPTATTPDFFNVCSNNIIPALGVPSNAGGTQSPHSGDGYVGLFGLTPPPTNQHREYLQQQLYNPLTAGTYYAEMYVSPSENKDIWIDKFGMHFSNAAIIFPNLFGNLNVTPQIESPVNIPLDDCNNWKRISGCFTTQGGEQFLTIGNFQPDANTNTFPSNCTPTITPSHHAAHLYVDDVTLIQMPYVNNHTFNLSCHTSTTIGPSIPCSSPLYNNISYSWSPQIGLSAYNIINPDANWIDPGGTSSTIHYVLTLTINGCSSTDYVDVTSQPGVTASINSSGTSLPCTGGGLTLNANPNGAVYSWSNGSTSQSITVNSPGTYTVLVTVGACHNTASYTVLPASANVSITGPANHILPCVPSTIMLTASGSPSIGTYAWTKTGSTIIIGQNPNLNVTTTYPSDQLHIA